MSNKVRKTLDLYRADEIGIKSAINSLKDQGCSNTEIKTFIKLALDL